MSYKNLIDSNLNRAFNLVKDLALDAVLSKKSDVTFDFAAGSTVPDGTIETVDVKIIVVEVNKEKQSINRQNEHKGVKNKIMLKRKEIGDLSIYDSINYEGFDWNIASTIKSDGYISMLEVHRST